MSTFTFVALVLAFVSIGGVLQGTRFTTFNNSVLERREQIHREASMELRRSQHATMGADRQERIRTFLEHRMSTIDGERSYHRLLPPADNCSPDTHERELGRMVLYGGLHSRLFLPVHMVAMDMHGFYEVPTVHVTAIRMRGGAWHNSEYTTPILAPSHATLHQYLPPHTPHYTNTCPLTRHTTPILAPSHATLHQYLPPHTPHPYTPLPPPPKKTRATIFNTTHPIPLHSPPFPSISLLGLRRCTLASAYSALARVTGLAGVWTWVGVGVGVKGKEGTLGALVRVVQCALGWMRLDCWIGRVGAACGTGVDGCRGVGEGGEVVGELLCLEDEIFPDSQSIICGCDETGRRGDEGN
ncbi:predicted protein [Plenodomus lingam JN3]|uniref:Predicted protein n=1 Tax=Leptosphaeria maculans (strain JN3 / isolate v23.1.3 / race Av1-4-5-6-7-8) TaxID=985895 RepID=E5A3Y3_LEPMJ|nr:predicted protein [Plenodomus lingam JN3]CBX98328.1 predicted protein [Plenodomus lingam JN3]